MGIAIDANIYMLCRMFEINPRKLSEEYKGKSVEEIMEAEAAQGNSAAAKFDREILNNPAKLIELFKLDNIENKYAILSNMNEHDLEELLPYLDVEDLTMGLNFFTKDKLLKLIEELPPEQLVKFVLEMFSPEQLMQLMPEKQLDKFLQNTKLDKNMEIELLKSMKPEVLAQMLEAATGVPVGGEVSMSGQQQGLNAKSLVSQIESLPDDKFQEALLNIPPQHKKLFVLGMVKQDQKLLELFEADAYTNIIGNQKEKEDMIKAANVLEPEHLVKMVQELPKDLVAVVVTQIDPKQFAEILIANFKDILAQLALG